MVANMSNARARRAAFRRIELAFLLATFFCAGVAAAEQPAYLALKKPATASSVENDEHNAARANDGNPATCWRADDEPENGPEWWKVDLEKPARLRGCRVTWPYENKNYRYKVEGSLDGKDWTLLSDQTRSSSKAQTHELKFEKGLPVRFVRITVTGFDEGCWASICEVEIFGRP